MKHWVKHFIIKNIFLVRLINWVFNFFNRKEFERKVQYRSKFSLFNYDELVKPLPYSPDELVIDNNLYGIAYCLKKYAGIDSRKSLNAYIEHGVFFGNLVRLDQKIWPVKSILTYGERRVEHLKNSSINKTINAIGPYIHYANSLLNKVDLEKLKIKLGKTLLVFPSHSMIGVDTKFDNDAFIKEIEVISSDFDTVLISLYWTDVFKKGLVNVYEKKGYKIVTSGHRFDLNFLSRQRSIIELADFTMSNSVGTHVGYCVHLNKPHYIFKQDVKNVGNTKNSQKYFNRVRNTIEMINSEKKEKDEIYQVFSNYPSLITEEQNKVVDKYWGTSYIQTKEELFQTLSK